MKTSYIIFLLFFLIARQSGFGQTEQFASKERFLRMMFYNVENLFDTEKDSLTNDGEFLPEGQMHWTKNRYWEKLQHISSVIVALGGWSPPDVIGFCEIENRKVLEDLCFRSSLAQLNYRIIHKESPDPRGIDVALIYQPKSFKPLGYKALAIKHPDKPGFRTREILYVYGQVKNDEILHVFINHWPSRSGGQIESEPNRILAAGVLRKEIDSVFKENHKAKVVIMGDFNDYPDNVSLVDYLRAKNSFGEIQPAELYNLSASEKQNRNTGSHKFAGEWGMLDQIIVSGSLLNKGPGLSTSMNNVFTFNAPFLLEEDEAFAGKKPFRTYLGFRYHGGYSDHLPVFLDFINSNITDNEEN